MISGTLGASAVNSSEALYPSVAQIAVRRQPKRRNSSGTTGPVSARDSCWLLWRNTVTSPDIWSRKELCVRRFSAGAVYNLQIGVP